MSISSLNSVGQVRFVAKKHVIVIAKFVISIFSLVMFYTMHILFRLKNVEQVGFEALI